MDIIIIGTQGLDKHLEVGQDLEAVADQEIIFVADVHTIIHIKQAHLITVFNRAHQDIMAETILQIEATLLQTEAVAAMVAHAKPQHRIPATVASVTDTLQAHVGNKLLKMATSSHLITQN